MYLLTGRFYRGDGCDKGPIRGKIDNNRVAASRSLFAARCVSITKRELDEVVPRKMTMIIEHFNYNIYTPINADKAVCPRHAWPRQTDDYRSIISRLLMDAWTFGVVRLLMAV